MSAKSASEVKEDIELETVTKTPSSIDALPATTAQKWTAEEEKQLLFKIDMVMLPSLWLMNLISHLDRSKLFLPLFLWPVLFSFQRGSTTREEPLTVKLVSEMQRSLACPLI